MKFFGKELKFNNNKVYHSGDKPTPNEIGAATGKTVSATTAATAQWYRIATSPAGISRCMGNFTIEATVSGKHSATNLIAGVNYGINPTIQQISHSDYSAAGITKARIVYHTSYNGNYAYLEVYQPTATATAINVSAVNLVGWTLVTPSTVGSIPSGYTSKEITLVNNKIVANIQGSVSGSAGSATKATQDSAGQQINTTYIKGLSVSGKTITYTKGDGTTGTITTQDTNTTYSVGTASALGLTKLYTGTGTATDGTMTQSAINTALNGKAAASHTHNYAGSSSAGGAANSANTLTTARTINGTSFNGSANITTANWGTARNITIGNTAKSVNGSGNVAWSLSEIGAAASSHTHNYAGSPSAGGGANKLYLPRTGNSTDVTYSPGTHVMEVREYDSACPNLPTKDWYHVFSGMGGDSGYQTQLALGMTTSAVYFRNKVGNTWNGWRRFMYSDEGMKSVTANGHWGMLPADGNDNAWIRTTRQGIIPFQAGGNGGLGTSSWPFSYAHINDVNAVTMRVSQVNGETKFAQNSSYSDPWNGTGCAIKATGNIAATGIIRANQYLQVGGTPLSIQSSAPGVGGVWIQI